MNEVLLANAIAKIPHVKLGFFPTPLHECPRLSESLKGPRILMKRDDCSGLAFGGNKTRHLEFSMAHALAQRADMVIVGAAVQSNYCRQTAAAAARLGLRCHLVLTRAPRPEILQGNYLIDRVMGADIELVDATIGEALDLCMQEAATRLRQQGWSPYILRERPRCDDLGALSYAKAVLEMHQQLRDLAIHADYIYCAAAGPTQAGLLVGVKALKMATLVHGITPIRWDYDLKVDVTDNANRVFKLLDVPLELLPEEVLNWDEYVGEAYGEPTLEAMEAISTVARTEGILLDPVYTGKAMAGLFDHIRTGLLPRDSTVIFLHTGGTPALFAYASELNFE